MEPTGDVLDATRGARKSGSMIVGFALETGDALAKGLAKLERKGLDLIVVNDALEPGAGFEHDTNRVALLGRDGTREILPLQSKREVAAAMGSLLVSMAGLGGFGALFDLKADSDDAGATATRGLSEEGGRDYPVIMGDYASEQARWESRPIIAGTPLQRRWAVPSRPPVALALVLSAPNTLAEKPGATFWRTVGPSRMPATTSPMTAGCWRKRNSLPIARACWVNCDSGAPAARASATRTCIPVNARTSSGVKPSATCSVDKSGFTRQNSANETVRRTFARIRSQT